METELAIESVRPRVADRAEPVAVSEFPRAVHVLLLAGIAGLQVAWLMALGALVHWLA